MNWSQRGLLILAVLVLTEMVLFPPWESIKTTAITRTTYADEASPLGYAFIGRPPPHNRYARIDVKRLAIQALVVTGVAAILMFWAQCGEKPATTDPPVGSDAP